VRRLQLRTGINTEFLDQPLAVRTYRSRACALRPAACKARISAAVSGSTSGSSSRLGGAFDLMVATAHTFSPDGITRGCRSAPTPRRS
jgi:hypothetical protein